MNLFFFCKEDARTSSFNILNALNQRFAFLSVFRVEGDLDSGYFVHPAQKCYKNWANFDWPDSLRLLEVTLL